MKCKKCNKNTEKCKCNDIGERVAKANAALKENESPVIDYDKEFYSIEYNKKDID